MGLVAEEGGVHAFKLDAHGLARVLGELEADIMDVLWSLGRGRVSDVCAALGSDANYKTVMTVMNRLVEKRLLERSRDRRAFVYEPIETRDEFRQRISLCVAEGLVREFGDVAVAQFVHAVRNVEPALLVDLRSQLDGGRMPEALT